MITLALQVTTILNIDGTAHLSNGIFELNLSSEEILRFLKNSNKSNFSLSVMNYYGLDGQFKEINLRDSSSGSTSCEKLTASTQYTSNGSGGKGSLTVILGVDRTGCGSDSSRGTPLVLQDSAAANTGVIVAAVVVPVVAIAIAASVAVWQRQKLAAAMKRVNVQMARATQGERKASASSPTPNALPNSDAASSDATEKQKLSSAWSSGRRDTVELKNM